MERLYLEGSAEAPTINFDPIIGRFEISGKSILNNAEAHFRPAVTWLKQFAGAPFSRIELTFNLEYFNISTSKMVLELLYTLDRMAKAGWEVGVAWCYPQDDDHMREVGADMSQLVSIPFRFPEPKLAPAVALV